MQTLSTEKFLTIKALTTEITKLEGEIKEQPEAADKLQQRANEFKKYVIRIDASNDNAEVEKIREEIRGSSK